MYGNHLPVGGMMKLVYLIICLIPFFFIFFSELPQVAKHSELINTYKTKTNE
ncbi:hypothetical protein C8N37_103352 [Sphingobacterium faecium]|nr:hypothetical protein C8N37_103352 [Sphingobacterium faecium]